jgi:hypothetical protein
MLGAIGAGAAVLGPALHNIRELGRKRPILPNAKRGARQLDAALEKHVDDIKPGASIGTYNISFNEPRGNTALEVFNDVRNDGKRYASSTSPGQAPGIAINPNADRAYLAHEMGHLASQQTDIGHLAASLRANPKLATALTGALMTAPGIAAAVQAGDDDMDESLALAAMAGLPTLVDEGLATRHGLAIMDKAGMRATLGQRGKLAGGFMSYLAPAIVAGTLGNVVGNQLDSDA